MIPQFRKFAALLAFLLPTLMIAQESPLNQRILRKLRVQKLQVQKWKGEAFKGDPVHILTYEYDPAGQLIHRQSWQQNQHSPSILNRFYDEEGQLVMETLQLSAAQLTSTSEKILRYEQRRLVEKIDKGAGLIHRYRYSSSGRLKSHKIEFEDGTPVSNEFYAYDRAGRLIFQKEVGEFMIRTLQVQYNAEGKKSREMLHIQYHGEEKGEKKLFRHWNYNDEGLIASMQILDQHRHVKEERTFEYDSANRLVRKNEGDETWIYEWGEVDQLLQTQKYQGQKLKWTMTYQYDIISDVPVAQQN